MIDYSEVHILVADDRQEIIDDINKILTSRQSYQESEIAALQQELFSDAPPADTQQQREEPKTQYHITSVNQGEEAITAAQHALSVGKPFALAFVDIRMPPGIDGVETAEILHQVDPQMHIVFMSAYSDYSRENILKKIGQGARDKILYIGKPFSADEIRHIAGLLSEMWKKDQRRESKTARTQKIHLATVYTLINLLENRKGKSFNEPSLRIAKYTDVFVQCIKKNSTPEISEYIDEQYIQDIVKASIFYDIGTACLSDSLLSKKEALDMNEHKIIEDHCKQGCEAITRAINSIGLEQTYLHLAREIASCHHEKFDGTGYPAGLKGSEIPLSARIVSLIGVYDALTTNRHHRKALTHDQAKNIIENEMGTQYFDPVVLNAFKQCHNNLKQIKQEPQSWIST